MLLSFNKDWHSKCDFCDKQYKEIYQICIALHVQRAFPNNGDYYDRKKCMSHPKRGLVDIDVFNQNQTFVSETNRIWLHVFGEKNVSLRNPLRRL
jgi:hypothetical protein